MRMATHPLWNDDYWLLVLQLYLKRPTGVKAVYAREAVDLAMELHLPPQFIHQQLQEMDRRDRLVLQLVWKTYAQKPRRLAKDIARLRKMKGFGCEQAFYEGVEVRNTFEDFFLPLTEDHELKPVMLVLVLDLYFRLGAPYYGGGHARGGRTGSSDETEAREGGAGAGDLPSLRPLSDAYYRFSPPPFGSVPAGVEPLRQWSTHIVGGAGRGVSCLF